MRLRFKVCQGVDGTSNRFSALVDDNCDWQQLHAAILLAQPKLERPALSLNKKDCLRASAGDKVKSLGIRSGDLIWVMAQNIRQHPETCDTRHTIGQPHSCQLQSADLTSPDGQEDASCATPRQTTETSESLASAVHQALVDGGLQHLKGVSATGQPGDLTAGLQTYALRGTSATPARACCKVRYIRLGSSVVVWAATATMGTRSICLTPSAANGCVPQGCQGDVLPADTLSHRVHDEMLSPVLQALCREEGLSPPSSLGTLPLEIKMLILHSLPARELALLACTCKDFSRLASAEELWERLFKREFADARAQPQSVSGMGWKGRFADAWKGRAERRRHRHSLRSPSGRLPWPGREGAGLFGTRSPALPGIAGGDIDRLPQPFLNIPRPYGGAFGSRRFQML